MSDYQLLRHTVATLAYRLRKCLAGAPDGFAEFTPGSGARDSLRILRHMTSAMIWMRSHFGDDFVKVEPVDWVDEITRLEKELNAIDNILEKQVPPVELSLERILAGPLSDAMTHVGQLALYRRLAGSPIPGENFTKADIAPGRLALH